MWPDTMPEIEPSSPTCEPGPLAMAASLRFGYRTHVVVRETEAEARAAAARLLSKLDALEGEAIRNRSLDTASAGVSRQAELRDTSDDDGFVEEHLWTGIARARSGLRGSDRRQPHQVVAKLALYMALGIDAFILSGYPHLDECDLVAKHVLPALRQIG
jgi:alkanesulfonate monooxygenase